MSNTVEEEIESKKETFRRHFRAAKKELESEHTNWSRLQRWVKLAEETATRLSELAYVKKIKSDG